MALVQRDVKRMLAYSSINHAGFVLLGVQAASAQGVEGSLYYLFVYTFMVIGTFAVVSVVGGRGDGAHDLERYRGLAARQPWLAAAIFAVLSQVLYAPRLRIDAARFRFNILLFLPGLAAAIALHAGFNHFTSAPLTGARTRKTTDSGIRAAPARHWARAPTRNRSVRPRAPIRRRAPRP